MKILTVACVLSLTLCASADAQCRNGRCGVYRYAPAPVYIQQQAAPQLVIPGETFSLNSQQRQGVQAQIQMPEQRFSLTPAPTFQTLQPVAVRPRYYRTRRFLWWRW